MNNNDIKNEISELEEEIESICFQAEDCDRDLTADEREDIATLRKHIAKLISEMT